MSPSKGKSRQKKPSIKLAQKLARKHHIDKRAAKLVTENTAKLVNENTDSADDDLLTTTQVAVWLCVSIPWLEIGRGKGYGPPFVRLTKRCVRYKRGEVRTWLEERAHHCTSEYVGKQAEAESQIINAERRATGASNP
jgi:predicted DNA-binding transcriptional regulator AlpA